MNTGERHIGIDALTVPLGDGTELVIAPHQNRVERVPSPFAEALRRCHTLESLEAHATGLPFRLGEALPLLRSRGLLLSESELMRLCAVAEPEPVEPIPSIGFVTRDRLPTLCRSVRSFAAHTREHGRAPEFVILDGGADADQSRRAAERLKALAHEEQVQLRYGGIEEKTSWCREVRRLSNVPADVLEFALFGLPGFEFAAGANRNCLLLDAVGRRCLSVDDDMIAEAGQAPDCSGQLRFSDDEPSEIWFFRGEGPLEGDFCASKDDLLAAHERLLGRGLGSCISDFFEVDLAGVAAHFRRPLETGGGRVRLSVSGVLGDCGLSDALPYLVKGGATLERLLGRGHDYLANRATRRVLRVVTDTTITRRPFCMTGAVGLDHSRSLPPFLPVGRGEDGLFAMLLRVCGPEDLIGLLPLAVRHEPPDVRAWGAGPLGLRTLTLAHALGLCVSSLFMEHLPLDPPGRMRLIGRCLVELSALRWPDLAEVIRLQSARSLGRRITSCEALLRSRPDGHPEWRRDLSRHLDSALLMLKDVDRLYPCDLREAPDHRGTAFPIVLRHFGRLLEAWPAIVDAATSLAQSGQRLAQPISDR